MPHHRAAEVDPTPVSPQTATPARTVSELENPSFVIYHELPTSPHVPDSSPVSHAAAHKPSSSSQPTHTSVPVTADVSSSALPDNDGEDAELTQMKEIEALRVQKERVRQLQDIEMRERELRRRIVERELAASSQWAPGGGGLGDSAGL